MIPQYQLLLLLAFVLSGISTAFCRHLDVLEKLQDDLDNEENHESSYILLRKILSDLRGFNPPHTKTYTVGQKLPGIDLGFGRAVSGARLGALSHAVHTSKLLTGPGKR